MDHLSPQQFTPFVQYGAVGICAICLFVFGYVIWLNTRDRNSDRQDRARERELYKETLDKISDRHEKQVQHFTNTIEKQSAEFANTMRDVINKCRSQRG